VASRVRELSALVSPPDEARAAVERLDAMGYRHPAYLQEVPVLRLR
jgi:hypothetical protein